MPKKSAQYDIFISYRRDGGESSAQLLCDRLTQKGYRVAFDVETLRSGKFDTQLLTLIQNCRDVIVVLSPGALDRCQNTDDWVRLEVAHALRCGKNIIPILLRNFEMPPEDSLPEDIRQLVKYNGVSASGEHFESSFARLCTLLLSRPSGHRRGKWIMALLLAAVLVALGGIWFYHRPMPPFPQQQTDKNLVSELLQYLGFELAQYNIVAGAADQFYEVAQNYLSAPATASSYRLLQAAAGAAEFVIDGTVFAPSDKLVADLRKTPISGGDLAALPATLGNLRTKTLSDIKMLTNLLNPQNPTSLEDKRQILALDRQNSQEMRRITVYGVMGLLSPIDQANEDMKTMQSKLIPIWTSLPFLETPWQRDMAFCTSKNEQSLQKIEQNIQKLAAITGTQNQLLHQEYADYNQKLQSAGATPEQAARMTQKAKDVAVTQELLNTENAKIAQLEIQVSKKFAPLPTDDPGIVWGKMLHFLAAEMPDDALKCLQMLRQRQTPEVPVAALDAAEQFIRQRGTLPFQGGAMVIGLVPPATRHAILQTGDIVTQINGKPCRTRNDYTGTPGNQLVIYRLTPAGVFEKIEAAMPPEQPKINIAGMAESED